MVETQQVVAETQRTELVHGLRAIGRVLGVGKDAAHRLARDGAIPAAMIGGRWRVARGMIGPYVAALGASGCLPAAAVAAPQHAPRGGGVVPGPRPLAGGLSRRKKRGGKAPGRMQKVIGNKGLGVQVGQSVGTCAEVPTAYVAVDAGGCAPPVLMPATPGTTASPQPSDPAGITTAPSAADPGQ